MGKSSFRILNTDLAKRSGVSKATLLSQKDLPRRITYEPELLALLCARPSYVYSMGVSCVHTLASCQSG